MHNFDTVDAALDFAINEEEGAYVFYMDLASKVEKSEMKDLFEQFAGEEQGHKEKLLSVKEGKALLSVTEKVANLKISDYVVDVDPNEELDYQGALLLAMKKEKAAFKMYIDLYNNAPSDRIKNTFLAIAQEEAKHKLRFEIEYDDLVMEEN